MTHSISSSIATTGLQPQCCTEAQFAWREAPDGRPQVRNPQQARRLDSQCDGGVAAALCLAAATPGAAEVAAELPVPVECVPLGDGAGLLVLGHPGRRDDEDAELGLGALALRRERGGDLSHVWLDRVLL